MKTVSPLLWPTMLSMLSLLAAPQPPDPRNWNFDSTKDGQLPAGFSADVGQWKVTAHASAPSKPNVYAQFARSERPVFNLSLVNDTNYRDVEIAVKFLALAGEIDQGGGVVWRARDAKNYYIARYNPLENNYRVYKVVDGSRTQLATADVQRSEGWHTLRIVMKGNHVQCFYDGQKHLDVRDDTFAEGGKIGLWTKADAQTAFDDLTVSIAR